MIVHGVGFFFCSAQNVGIGTTNYFNSHPKLVASSTLKEFQDLLPADIFFRAHHSHLINLSYIKRYLKGDGGLTEMQNGNFVDLARRKKDEFLKMLGY